MSGIRELYELQEIDLHIDALRKRLTQIEKLLQGSPELVAAKAELGAREARLRDSAEKQRTADEDATGNQSRINLQESRMYGEGASAKGLQSMTAEIAHLRERQSALETAVLQAMEVAEQDRRDATEQRAVAAAEEAKWAAQRNMLAEEQGKLQAEWAPLRASRAQHAALLTPAQFRLYEQIRAQKGNLAVVKVERGQCTGCRMTIPTMLVQKARAGREFVRCSSCDRLLFAT